MHWDSLAVLTVVIFFAVNDQFYKIKNSRNYGFSRSCTLSSMYSIPQRSGKDKIIKTVLIYVENGTQFKPVSFNCFCRYSSLIYPEEQCVAQKHC